MFRKLGFLVPIFDCERGGRAVDHQKVLLWRTKEQPSKHGPAAAAAACCFVEQTIDKPPLRTTTLYLPLASVIGCCWLSSDGSILCDGYPRHRVQHPHCRLILGMVVRGHSLQGSQAEGHPPTRDKRGTPRVIQSIEKGYAGERKDGYCTGFDRADLHQEKNGTNVRVVKHGRAIVFDGGTLLPGRLRRR